MPTAKTVRAMALGLPGATEEDHHGFPSFRVGGRIFATMPRPDALRVMLDEPGIRSAVAAWPGACREYYWGRRLACAEVDLREADQPTVRELLHDRWQHQNGRVR